MTVDQIIEELGKCKRRLKVLRDDNQRLWDSREEWKAKHREARREIQTLRQRVKRLDRTRLELRARERKTGPAPWANTTLTHRDLKRILGMKPRD